MNALHRPIAIVGMACCLPGADNLEAFWTLLKEGRCAVAPLPEERLNRELYFAPTRGLLGKSYSDLGGVVSQGIGDSELFSERDLAEQDPSHLRFCEVAHRAWNVVKGGLTNVGVYVGGSGGSDLGGDLDLNWLAEHIFAPLTECRGFATLSEDLREEVLARTVSGLRELYPRRRIQGKPLTGAGCVAELTADKLGFIGPRMAIDAACASSLVAFAVAAAALETGSIEAAIVGGASHSKPSSLVLFSRAHSCSATGSRPFDDEADGLVSSEGYVALAIKTLERAREDGDEVIAVVRGLGLSSDGRGRSLWAPRKQGQTAAMRRAYAPNVEPSSVQYIEAHATSTRVGDATELDSLQDFFGPHLGGGKVPIGSVKSNIGHTLETAGLASLLKVVLALQHRLIPPTLKVEVPNREHDWSSSAFRLIQEAMPWPEPEYGLPRRAAVSAFGIGGLNIHVVVEEPTVPRIPADRMLVGPAPLAIVGRGVVLPGASSLEQFAKLLASPQESCLTRPPAKLWHHEGAPLVGVLNGYEFDWLHFKLPPKQVERMNPLQLSLLGASEQALGKLPVEGKQAEREVTVVVGSPFGGDFGRQLLLGLRLPEFARILANCLNQLGVESDLAAQLVEQYEHRMINLYPALLDETGGFTASTLASRITKTFNLSGGAMAIDASQNSSGAAIAVACDLLRTGSSEAVLCAAAQSDIDAVALDQIPTREHPPGEGVAVILLRRLEDARRDGDRVFGVIEAAAWRPPIREAEAQPREPDSLYKQIGDLRSSHLMVSLVRRTLMGEEPLEPLRSGSQDVGGYEVSVALSPRESSPPRVIRLAAPDRTSLKVRLESSNSGQLWCQSQAGFSEVELHRLAIVARDQESLAAKLELAISQFESVRSQDLLQKQGIFSGVRSPSPPRVAFVFAGQGSQYSGMVSGLLGSSQAARSIVSVADNVLREIEQPSFLEMVSREDGSLDQDPVVTQLAVLIADMVIFSALVERGASPDCVCGHSFGEIPAMVAAGAWSLPEAIRFTYHRAVTLVREGGEGGLLSIQASAEVVQALLKAQDVRLFQTHHNGPKQTVLGGRSSELQKFEVVLQAENISSRWLKVPGPLHTPLLEATRAPLEEYLSHQRLAPPRILLASNVTADYVVRPEQLKANLVDQLTRPVLYQAMIERLIEDGVEILVEVGPGRVLTGLHRQFVSRGVVAVASDAPGRCQEEQILAIQACLECQGVLTRKDPGSESIQRHQWPIEDFDATAPRRLRNRSKASAPASVVGVAPRDSQMARFLVDYVVELTGYPSEVIDMNWDLEADLGLDSIKLAQLFGEIREVFELAIDDTVPVQEFRTLNQILSWLDGNQSPPVEGSSETQKFLIDYVVELTGYPAEVINLDWDLEADLGIDSIKLAQLFGELRENFSFGSGASSGEVNLADFRTLRQILAALEESPGAATKPAETREGSGSLPVHNGKSKVTSRYLMRLVDSPHRAGSPQSPQLHGACMIVGSNGVGECLATRLRELGARVHLLEPLDTIESTVQEFERLWADEPILHLFLVTPRDPDARTTFAESDWLERRHRALLSVYWLCQAWYKQVRKLDGIWEKASLVVTASLGGDFGFHQPVFSAESGGLAGLLKALFIETWTEGNRWVPFKIVDAPLDEPVAELVSAILRELAVPSYDLEIAYNGGSRSVVRAFPKSLGERAGQHRPEGVWIATGGGRGITAEAVRELSQRFGLKFHLLARSARMTISERWRSMWPGSLRKLKLEVMAAARAEGKASPVDEWLRIEKALELETTLENFKALGVQASYHCCDVSDRQALDRTLKEIRGQDGPIRGVLHGAGYSRDTKFENKEPGKVEQCIRAKVDGALALMELTRQDPLTHFLTFGSISGRFGANGHTDYSLSNDMVAKLVDWYRGERPEVAAVNFHWHAWGDVGMAMRADTQLGLEKIGMQFMPAREGLQHLVNEIEAGAPDGEVLITDDRYYRLFYFSESLGRQETESGLSLLAGAEISDAAAGKIFTITLDPSKDPFLVEHRLHDRPILPLVVALEAMAEASVSDNPSAKGVRFENVETGQALRFFDQSKKDVRIWVDSTVGGERPDTVACEVRSDFRSRDGTLVETDRLHFRALVSHLSEPPVVNKELCEESSGPWQRVDYSAGSDSWYHGPSLQNLRSICLQNKKAWGRVSAPAQVHLAGAERAGGVWIVPAAALDACFYAVACLAWAQLKIGATAPAEIRLLEIGRLPQPGESCKVQVELVTSSQADAVFDFQLYGDDGACLLSATGYRLTSLRSQLVSV